MIKPQKENFQFINNDQPDGVCKFIERASPRNIEKVPLLKTSITQPLATF